MVADNSTARLKGIAADLRAENSDLRAQLRQLKAERRLAGKLASAVASVWSLILFGPRLVISLQAWLEAKNASDPLPTEETAALGAAVLRRLLKVGVLGIIIAAVPLAMAYWQNHLTQKQINILQAQISERVGNELISRRVDLLVTIYELDCEQDGSEECSPRYPARVREEAVRALAQIERSRDVKLALGHVDLSRMDLSGADFGGGYLLNADFQESNLTGVNFRGAYLRGANMQLCDLDSANLGDADLRGANLEAADFDRSVLRGADLRGADLVAARNLNEEQIRYAQVDEATRLPYEQEE